VTARAWLTGLVLSALTSAAAGGVAVAEFPSEAVVSAGFAPALHDEISRRLDKTSAVRGLVAVLRDHRAPVLRRPLDSGLSWGASPLYCPHYWPTLYPGANLDQLCGSDYYQSEQLYQRNSENPFVIAREQFMALADSSDERADRLPWAAAYAALHRSGAEWATDTTLALLKRPQYLRAEVIADLAAPIVERLLPESLTSVEAGEGQIPVDVRVFSSDTYGSARSSSNSEPSGCSSSRPWLPT